MSRSPAANLARLKCMYPLWHIERRGDLYRATSNGWIIGWTSAADLEHKLTQQTLRGTS